MNIINNEIILKASFMRLVKGICFVFLLVLCSNLTIEKAISCDEYYRDALLRHVKSSYENLSGKGNYTISVEEYSSFEECKKNTLNKILDLISSLMIPTAASNLPEHFDSDTFKMWDFSYKTYISNYYKNLLIEKYNRACLFSNNCDDDAILFGLVGTDIETAEKTSHVVSKMNQILMYYDYNNIPDYVAQT